MTKGLSCEELSQIIKAKLQLSEEQSVFGEVFSLVFFNHVNSLTNSQHPVRFW